MTTTKVRKTVDEKIAEYEQKIKALKASKKSKSENKINSITKDSEGMQSLLEMISSVAKIHDLKVADVIKLVSKIKKTGLKITNSVRTKKIKDEEKLNSYTDSISDSNS